MEVPVDDARITARYALATEVIAEAASLALAYSRDIASLTVTHKGPQDLVSQADRAVEDLIAGRIRAAFPEDAFVGEETGVQTGTTGTWVVDPIDGTQDFLLSFPTWCVSIAFVAEGRMEFGLLTSPVTGDRYRGRRGHGSMWNDVPIRASTATSLAEGITCLGYSTKGRPADAARMLESITTAGGVTRTIGSGALMVVYVGTGQTLGYVESYINAWDCLAAMCIVQEAGGRTNDFLGEFGPAGHGPIVVGAPGVFDELSAILST